MEISLLGRTFSDLSSIHWMSVKRSQRTIHHTKTNCKIHQSKLSLPVGSPTGHGFSTMQFGYKPVPVSVTATKTPFLFRY